MNAFTRVTESNSRNCGEIVLFVILWHSSIDMVGQIYVYTISYVYIIVKKVFVLNDVVQASLFSTLNIFQTLALVILFWILSMLIPAGYALTKKINKDLEYVILKVLAIIISTVGIWWYKEKLAWHHKFLVELFIKTEKNQLFCEKKNKVKKIKPNVPDFCAWYNSKTCVCIFKISWYFWWCFEK